MLAIRASVHPTNFSPPSEAAFQLACSLARDHGARLIVLHVKPPAYTGGVTSQGYPLPSEPPETRQAVQEQLRRVRPTGSTPAVEHILGKGGVVAGILRTARECRCDLIVMGTHGHTGARRLLMGSVAEQVVRKAPCPVLTVKTPVADAPPFGEKETD